MTKQLLSRNAIAGSLAALGVAAALLFGGWRAISQTDGAVAGAVVCPVIGSRNWRAWVDPEAADGPRLHVSGEVDLPTPGYRIEWRLGPADRAQPPAQAVELIATPPSGMAIQMIATETVAFEGRAISTTYRAVRVVCAGVVVAEIDDIEPPK